MTNIIKKTTSICPECHALISADYIEEDGEVFMIKECKEHGKFRDLISINAKHFRWIQQFTMDSEAKMLNPQVEGNKKGCPLDCGICDFHKSAPAIAICDITYRCNLKCPFCFANALTEKGKNIEPSFNDLKKIYTHFRNVRPQPPVCAMFSGGEPTLREDFPEILSMARDLGYVQLQVATNGIRFAKDINFLKKCIDAGMNAMYLQFDGIGSEIYKVVRGADIWPLKQKVIENCRKLKFPHIILTPTVIKGINDNHVTKIFDFAIDNIDTISTISYQPISLCGRIDQNEINKLRYTSSHVIDALNKHTNGETGWMYPMPVLAKFSKVLAWINNHPNVLELTCNSICGYGTFIFIDPKTKKIRDITKIFNVPKFTKVMDKWYNRLRKKQEVERKYKDILDIGPISRSIGDLLDRGGDAAIKARFFAEFISTLRNPLSDGVRNFINRFQILLNMAINSSRDASADYLIKGNNLLISLMQFQDGYNMDVERACRCLVHYGYVDPKTSKVMAVPFCPMNTIHRPRIENELLMAQAVTKEDMAEPPVPKLQS
ncbi:MAG: radical SAM protein [Promethearchaeota archaeon]